jgi:hypothetical protein
VSDNQYVQQAIYELTRLRRNEVDDCERALRKGDIDRARREIGDVDSKLRRVIDLLQAA